MMVVPVFNEKAFIVFNNVAIEENFAKHIFYLIE